MRAGCTHSREALHLAKPVTTGESLVMAKGRGARKAHASGVLRAGRPRSQVRAGPYRHGRNHGRPTDHSSSPCSGFRRPSGCRAERPPVISTCNAPPHTAGGRSDRRSRAAPHRPAHSGLRRPRRNFLRPVPHRMIAREGASGMSHLPVAERNSASKRAASVNLAETSGHAFSISPCLRR